MSSSWSAWRVGSWCSSCAGRSIVTSRFRWRSRSAGSRSSWAPATGAATSSGRIRRPPGTRTSRSAFLLPLIALASQSLFRGNTWRRVVLVLLDARARRRAGPQARPPGRPRPAGQGQRPWSGAGHRRARTRRADVPARPTARTRSSPRSPSTRSCRWMHDGKLPSLDEATIGRSPHRARPPRPLRRPRSGRAREPGGADRVGPTHRPATPAPTVASPRARATATSSCCASPRPGTFRVRGDGVLGLRLRDTASRAQGEIVSSRAPA